MPRYSTDFIATPEINRIIESTARGWAIRAGRSIDSDAERDCAQYIRLRLLERHRAWELADPVEPLIQHMATGFALEMTRQARAESRDAGVTVPLDDHDAAQTDVAETRARILEALARLPEAQRQVVSLLLAGHGQADAGAACGVSRDAAYRAQVALDAIFEADEI